MDDNCDGTVDGPTSVDTVSRYPDADGDSYGLDPHAICPDEDGPGGLRSSAGYDCDDTNPLIHPDSTEACNGVDDDCDATTGEDGFLRFVDFTGEEAPWSAIQTAGSSLRMCTSPTGRRTSEAECWCAAAAT